MYVHFTKLLFSCFFFQFTNILFCISPQFYFQCCSMLQVLPHFYAIVLYSLRKVNATSILLLHFTTDLLYIFKFYCSVLHDLTSILIHSLVYISPHFFFYSVVLQFKTLFSVSLQFYSVRYTPMLFHFVQNFNVLYHATFMSPHFYSNWLWWIL